MYSLAGSCHGKLSRAGFIQGWVFDMEAAQAVMLLLCCRLCSGATCPSTAKVWAEELPALLCPRARCCEAETTAVILVALAGAAVSNCL